MYTMLKLLLSLFIFLALTSLISYHVIGDTKMIKINSIGLETDQVFLRRILELSTSRNYFSMSTSIQIKQPKIFCIILTSKKNYKIKSKIIYDSWASKCDNYRFITMIPSELPESNSTENQFKNVSIEFEYNKQIKFLQPADLIHDQYDKLSEKVYLTFKDIYKRYNNYDWYLKSDDDTFIFVDNLRNFLSNKNSSSPVTFGYNFKVIVKKGYHSGGGGYVLSKESLDRLGSKLSENFSFCPNSGVEDVDVARCLRKLGVTPGISIDDEGKERFHPLSLMGHYNGDFPDWLYSYASNPIQKGLNCCSDSSISFHYMSVKEIVKLSSIIKDFNMKDSKNSENLTFKHILDNFE